MRQMALHALKISLLILQLFPNGAALDNVREEYVMGPNDLPLWNILTDTPLTQKVLDVAIRLVDSRGHFDKAVGALCFCRVCIDHLGL